MHREIICAPMIRASTFNSGNKKIPAIAKTGENTIIRMEYKLISLYLYPNLCLTFQNSNAGSKKKHMNINRIKLDPTFRNGTI